MYLETIFISSMRKWQFARVGPTRASIVRVCTRERARKTAQSLQRRASKRDSRAARTVLSWGDGRV